jgi:hypothetical protein
MGVVSRTPRTGYKPQVSTHFCDTIFRRKGFAARELVLLETAWMPNIPRSEVHLAKSTSEAAIWATHD